MKLASYKSLRKGLPGIANRLIRLRLRGVYSHSEILFEPSDGVDHLMPDGTCQPDANGALWCCSATAAERLPNWSRYRANKIGGVRFKRISIDPARWDLDALLADPVRAATWGVVNEGRMYDWQLIFGFLAWVIPEKDDRVMCSEACMAMLGVPEPWRFDPCTARASVVGYNNFIGRRDANALEIHL